MKLNRSFEVTEQNVLYHKPTQKLNRILESKFNSAKRFPELSVSLPELMQRSLRIALQV
ncbi:hypothetical protein [Leptospira interrogans]|uniref:hypothetical protein n=1 Tax=Leptospira interrogans TaxID=173 RepID=UPI0002FB3A81|nr:hypothetical protein [Leptospira interrogans]